MYNTGWESDSDGGLILFRVPDKVSNDRSIHVAATVLTLFFVNPGQVCNRTVDMYFFTASRFIMSTSSLFDTGTTEFPTSRDIPSNRRIPTSCGSSMSGIDLQTTHLGNIVNTSTHTVKLVTFQRRLWELESTRIIQSDPSAGAWLDSQRQTSILLEMPHHPPSR